MYISYIIVLVVDIETRVCSLDGFSLIYRTLNWVSAGVYVSTRFTDLDTLFCSQQTDN